VALMARKKNSAFVGVSVFDTDVDAPTFGRAIENTVGDVALVHDMLTGENGETNTINHSGDGRGAPLRVPLVNQFIDREIDLTAPATKDTNGGDGETMLLPYVVFVPPGEENIVFRFYMSTSDRLFSEGQMQLVVTDTSLVEEHRVEMSAFDEGGYNYRVSGNLVGVTPGLKIMSVRLRTDLVIGIGGDVPMGRIISCSIFSGARRLGQRSPRIEQDLPWGVTEPAATEGVAHVSFDEAMFGGSPTNEPIDAFITAHTNRNINGILEYTTGWPAGDNADYYHVDDSASNPTKSRFHAHTRSLYASEPEVAFPLWCQSFGAFLSAGKFVVDLAQPPTIGMLGWYAPWPISTGLQTFVSLPCLFPDFQSSSSRLKCAVLIGSDASAAVGNWTITCATSAGSASATPTACDGANTLWLASISAIPFTGDASDLIEIKTQRAGAKGGIGELCVLSVCVYYEP
jgi:hypothetical protein